MFTSRVHILARAFESNFDSNGCMDFRIAETFTGSLTRLTSDEQKAAKTTAFGFQLNPVSPGMTGPP